ncbi:zinc finger CCCH domain-containing protein 55 [Phtheirospermum japonicum]|uniref:Zinc finger CCCH domain-containing protein 55 n=1 Tax=Phtheirospermum japonicum TaxID=374723 RepID=A0A830DBV2_9LAMI|nr:zinc finger CCCH domain-containing protein 55 [Phtheirospermum japonicum]
MNAGFNAQDVRMYLVGRQSWASLTLTPDHEHMLLCSWFSKCTRELSYLKWKQQQMERGDFTGCGSPTDLESRDPFDLGERMFYNTRDMLWNKKLEEQADLQQAIELQNRRLMGLQLLDVKRNSHHHNTLSTGAVVSPPATSSPTSFGGQNVVVVVVPSNPSSPLAKEENGSIETVNEADKDKDYYSAKDDQKNVIGTLSNLATSKCLGLLLVIRPLECRNRVLSAYLTTFAKVKWDNQFIYGIP